ncbi:MAG: hypothetical protein KDK23_03935 [Leptospiraceae bacterium]|nr:hypothetical protein [Leptospiraceae bacterium]
MERLSLVVIILLIGACGALEDLRPRTMFGEGLSNKEDLEVYLNVGLLTAESEKLYPRETVERWLQSAGEALQTRYPGIRFHFILDQPQDLDFITGRAIGRNRLPLVSPFPLRKVESRQRYVQMAFWRPAIEYAGQSIQASLPPIASLLEALQTRTRPPELSALYEQWEKFGSDATQASIPAHAFLTFWQSYSSSQIHYDIILTDVSVLPDDPYRLRTTGGSPRPFYLIPAPGRPALDRMAVLVTIRPSEGDEAKDLPSNARRIEPALEAMLLGPQYPESGKMEARRLILAALSAFHNQGKKVGCGLWNQSSHLYIESREKDPLLLAIFEENRRNMDRLCSSHKRSGLRQ